MTGAIKSCVPYKILSIKIGLKNSLYMNDIKYIIHERIPNFEACITTSIHINNPLILFILLETYREPLLVPGFRINAFRFLRMRENRRLTDTFTR